MEIPQRVGSKNLSQSSLHSFSSPYRKEMPFYYNLAVREDGYFTWKVHY